jgi:hypothetical protein
LASSRFNWTGWKNFCKVLASNQLPTRTKSGCDQVTTENGRFTLF